MTRGTCFNEIESQELGSFFVKMFFYTFICAHMFRVHVKVIDRNKLKIFRV